MGVETQWSVLGLAPRGRQCERCGEEAGAISAPAASVRDQDRLHCGSWEEPGKEMGSVEMLNSGSESVLLSLLTVHLCRLSSPKGKEELL